jgi:hypothetical protein
VLQALGLSAKELRALDPAEALRRTAVALSQFAEDGDRARAVQILFGKSIREAGPLLNDLAQKQSLVATTTTAAALQAEEFNKKLFGLKSNAEDASRILASRLLPSISDLASELLIGLKHANGFFDALVTFGTINPFRSQAGNLRALRDELEGLQGARERYMRSGSDTRGIDQAIERTRRQLGYLSELQSKQALADVGDTSDFVSRRLMREGPAPSLRLPKDEPKRASGAANEAQRYLETLQRQLDATKNLTAAEQALADISSGRLSGITPTLREHILLTAGRVDASKRLKSQLEAEENQVRDLMDARRNEAAERARMLEQASQISTRSLEASLAEAASIFEGNEALREEIAIIAGGESTRRTIEQARISSAIAIKEETLAMLQNAGAGQTEIDVLRNQINLLRDRAKLLGERNIGADIAQAAAEQQRFLSDLAGTVARGFEDAIISGRGLREVIGSIGDDIQRILTRKLITEPLTQSILGVLQPSNGGLGGFLSGLLGFADGGRPPVGRPSIVGEQGMELFIPDTPGRILSAADTKAALANTGTVERRPINVTNHFAISGQVGRGTQEQIAARVGREVRNAQSRHTA